MKIFACFTLFLSVAPVWAQNSWVFDSAEYFAEISPPQTGPRRALNRNLTPQNAPFLRLRPDNALFAARRWFKSGKREAPALSSQELVLLRAKNRFYEVGDLREGQFEIEPSASIFFDWEVNEANARKMRALNGNGNLSLSIAQFQSIKKAIQPRFPNSVRDQTTPQIVPFQIVGKNKNRRAVFEFLRYDGDEIYKERLELGRGIYRDTRRIFIASPPRVSADELTPTEHIFPNAPMHDYRPETLALNRARLQKMREFHALVKTFLPKN